MQGLLAHLKEFQSRLLDRDTVRSQTIRIPSGTGASPCMTPVLNTIDPLYPGMWRVGGCQTSSQPCALVMVLYMLVLWLPDNAKLRPCNWACISFDPC